MTRGSAGFSLFAVQLAPVGVWFDGTDGEEDHPELIDGFTRLGAAEQIDPTGCLQARRSEAHATTAKAAACQLNRVGRGPLLEQARIVHADGRQLAGAGISDALVLDALSFEGPMSTAPAGSTEGVLQGGGQ